MRLSIRDYFKNLFKRCECGHCNCLIPIINTKGKFAKYKHGHNAIGEKSPNYKGGITKNGKYKMFLKHGHPNATKQGYMRVHRLIYEHYLKILFDEDIYIPKEIDIHHIIPVDKGGTNALINLTCVTRPEHTKIHKSEIRKDMSEWFCSHPDCKSPNRQTSINIRDGRPNWGNDNNGGHWCSRCFNKEYYKKNKDKLLKQQREHYKNNKEKILRQQKEYYEKNKKIKKNYSQSNLFTFSS